MTTGINYCPLCSLTLKILLTEFKINVKSLFEGNFFLFTKHFLSAYYYVLGLFWVLETQE